MGLALSKELKGEAIEGVFTTGEFQSMGNKHSFVQGLNTRIELRTHEQYSSRNFKVCSAYRISARSLPSNSSIIDFRQHDFSYPHPWKRLLDLFQPILLRFAF